MMYRQAMDTQTHMDIWYRQAVCGWYRQAMDGQYRQAMDILSLIGFSSCSLTYLTMAALMEVAAYLVTLG